MCYGGMALACVACGCNYEGGKVDLDLCQLSYIVSYNTAQNF